MGSSQSVELQNKRVVIVGGGYGGITAANKLLGKCQLTLIDPKEAFHHCLAALRSCTQDGLAGKTFIPYEPAFGEIFKRGTVESIDASSKEVLLSGGESIGYDYLIIATGINGPFPGNVEGGEDTDVYVSKYAAMLQKVKLANNIVVIGGGAVGLEMAGEISTDYPKKSVTVVHSREYLVEGDLRSVFRDGVRDQLVAKGVKLVLGEKVTNLNDIPRDGSSKCTVKTDKGTKIEADLAIVCIGQPGNSSTTYSKSLQSSMTERGYLRVNEFLQVDGLTDVFAIGDCCESGAVKMAYIAGYQGELAADNIWYSAEKKSLKSWKQMGVMIILPIGRNGGMFQLGNWVFGSFLSRKIKSEHLFVHKYWAEMKQKVPTETYL